MAHQEKVLRKRTLWLEVGDLLAWPHSHVTGMPRTALSILCELRTNLEIPFRLRYCRYLSGKGFVEVDDSQIASAIARLVGDTPRRGDPHIREVAGLRSNRFEPRIENFLRRIYRRLPSDIAAQSLSLYDALSDWISACRAHVVYRAGSFIRRTTWKDSARMFSKSDILLSLIQSMNRRNSGYVFCVEDMKRRDGFQYVAIIYDLIPWKLPNLFPSNTYNAFVPWLKKTIQTADLVLTISENTKRDLVTFLTCEGMIPKEVEVIRLGDKLFTSTATRGAIREVLRSLAKTGYVLFVSTTTNRKDHRLLYYVWKVLLERHGERVPPMMWAGVWGPYGHDLQFEMASNGDLKGRLITFASVSDEELDFLYKNCLFTLYPSIYEGWGLPVAESVAHGKYCVASNASSIPEIAGDLIDYHAPGDFDTCYRLVERAIFDDQFRKAKEEEICTKYRAHTWTDCTLMIIEKIQARFPAESEKMDQLVKVTSGRDSPTRV